MKPIYWILIAVGFSISLLTLFIVLILVFSLSWWWIAFPLTIIFLTGIITGIIILTIKLTRRRPMETLRDPEDAEENAIFKLLYDDHNPDNFIRGNRKKLNVGEPGKERTPILWLKGKGSETDLRIDILMNLKDKNEYPLFLYDSEDEDVIKASERFADNPAEVETSEKINERDPFGNPIERIITKKISSTEKKKEEETKEALEREAY